jgi:flagellar hook protein FlgE
MGLASALSTALTGLAASESMVDVAGNNVANANTVGFKQSSAVFTTQFLQTISAGTAPSGNQGGTDPEQVGLGTQVASITPDFSQGTIQNGGSPTDLAIQGNGFFIVQGSAGNTLYTRNGQFTLNSANQLVNTTGQILLGNGVNSNYQINGTTLEPLTIPIGGTSVAQATQNVFLQGDLSPTDAVATTPQIIDSQTLSDASVETPTNLTTGDLTAVPPPATSGSTAGASTTAGGLTADTYSYEVTFVNSAGQEGPPSSVVGPVTTTGTAGVDQSIQLSGLPSIPTGFTSMNVYRSDTADPGYKMVGSTTTSSFTDSLSDTQVAADPNLGAALNTNSLASGNYSYYVTFYNSTTGLESRPTQLIGPQSLSIDGRDIELSGIPSPSAGGDFNSVRIYRNTAANPSNFYLDTTLASGTSTYIDSTPDATIASNPQINLDGPGISSATLLTNLVQRSGSTYTQPFQNATQVNYTGSKGGITLTTQTLNVTNTTTVQDLIDFVDQASGIQPTSADSQDPLPGSPGGSVDTANSSIQFVSNNGDPNAVSIGLSALQVVSPSGTQAVNLNFNTTQQAVGTGASTSVVVYDSLGDPINVNINTVLESSSASGTVYRWFADSGNNQPATGNSIAVGTGEIKFDGQGNLVDVTQDQVSIDRSSSAALPLQFDLNFSAVSGLSVNSSTLAASRQDGSATGTLSTFTIDGSGLITGVFSNGVTRSLGQLQLAQFANDSGLEQQGQNLYAAGVDSGLPIVGTAGAQGTGTIVAGALEQSNADIGQNLINLITASTEYRSSAQVISTVQTLYETLLSLRTG